MVPQNTMYTCALKLVVELINAFVYFDNSPIIFSINDQCYKQTVLLHNNKKNRWIYIFLDYTA